MNLREELVIYLDQNKWIDLARAYHGHNLGKRYEGIFELIENAVKSKKVIMPLDSSRYIETLKIKNRNRKHRLAIVMGGLSQGWSLAPASFIVDIELDKAFSMFFGKHIPADPLVIGKGVGFAFGQAQHLYQIPNLKPPLDKVFIKFVESPYGVISFLEGIEGVGEQGVENHLIRIKEFSDKVERFRVVAEAYSKTVRVRSYAAEVTMHLQTNLEKALKKYNKTYSDYLGLGKDRLMEYWSYVPTIDTELQLATERTENYARPVSPNDLHDVGALSVAIPYCDIVVIEKYFADLAIRKKLDTKYRTKIFTDLRDLIGCLQESDKH